MKYVEVSRRIDAPIETVWSILTDKKKLVDGGFGITRLDGEIEEGAKLKLWAEVADRPITLKVARWSAPSRMVWRGGMPFGLFRGERSFMLESVSGATEFTLREEFSGPMLALIWRSMPDLQPSFDKFAGALKQHSESP